MAKARQVEMATKFIEFERVGILLLYSYNYALMHVCLGKPEEGEVANLNRA